MGNAEKIYTLSVLVDNEAGVLSQVSRMFSRKGYNIESLAVGITHDPTISRMTIELKTTQEKAELTCNQLRKLLPVHSVKLLSSEDAIKRELLLIKIATSDSIERNEVMQIANIFRASVIDVSNKSITLAIIGNNDKNHAFENLLEHLNIMEIVRTGIVALERGTSTIDEDTKEKGEFDYGKNVL